MGIRILSGGKIWKKKIEGEEGKGVSPVASLLAHDFEGLRENSKKSLERRTRFWGCGRPCVHRWEEIRSKEVERNEGFRGQLCHPLPT